MLQIYSTTEIIKNQRGGLKLVHEGYMYTKKYIQKMGLYDHVDWLK